jgi:O-antigen/teichoic acid export membrane protein
LVVSWRRIGLNSVYVAIATAALALLQWLIMAMIARREGSTALGEYALSQAFALPASYLAWLSIRQQLIISRTEGAQAADFMFLRTIAPLATFLPVLALIASVYESHTLLTMSACVFALKYVEGFFDLAYGYIQKDGDWRQLAGLTIVRSVISSVVFAVIYTIIGTAQIALLSLVTVWIVIYGAVDARRVPSTEFSEVFCLSKFTLSHRWRLVVHLLPLASSSVLMALITNSPRLVVEHHLGPAQLGFFAAVFHFVAVGSVATGSVGHAILPVLAGSIRNAHAGAFWRQLLGTMAIIQIACAMGIAVAGLFGTQLLRFIYGPAFAGQDALLVVAAAAAGPVYCASIAANGCYAAELRRGLLTSQVLALLTVLIATTIMVPRWGNFGAIGGMLMSALVQLGYCIGSLVWYWRRGHKCVSPLQHKRADRVSTDDGAG